MSDFIPYTRFITLSSDGNLHLNTSMSYEDFSKLMSLKEEFTVPAFREDNKVYKVNPALVIGWEQRSTPSNLRPISSL